MSVRFNYSYKVKLLQQSLALNVLKKRSLEDIFKVNLVWTNTSSNHFQLEQFFLEKKESLSLIHFQTINEGLKKSFKSLSTSFLDIQFILYSQLKKGIYKQEILKLFPFTPFPIDDETCWNLSYQILSQFREYENFFPQEMESWKKNASSKNENHSHVVEIQKKIYNNLLSEIKLFSSKEGGGDSENSRSLFFERNSINQETLKSINEIHLFLPICLSSCQIEGIVQILKEKSCDMVIYLLEGIDQEVWIKSFQENLQKNNISFDILMNDSDETEELEKTIIKQGRPIFSNTFEEASCLVEESHKILDKNKNFLPHQIGVGLPPFQEVSWVKNFLNEHLNVDKDIHLKTSFSFLDFIENLFNISYSGYSYESIQRFLNYWMTYAKPENIESSDLDTFFDYHQKLNTQKNYFDNKEKYQTLDYYKNTEKIILDSFLGSLESLEVQTVSKKIESEEFSFIVYFLVDELRLMEKSTNQALISSFLKILDIFFSSCGALKNLSFKWKTRLQKLLSVSNFTKTPINYNIFVLYLNDFNKTFSNLANSILVGDYTDLVGCYWDVLFLSFLKEDMFSYASPSLRPSFHLSYFIETENISLKIFDLNSQKNDIAFKILLKSCGYCYISLNQFQDIQSTFLSKKNEGLQADSFIRDFFAKSIEPYINTKSTSLEKWTPLINSERKNIIKNNFQQKNLLKIETSPQHITSAFIIDFLKQPYTAFLKNLYGWYNSYFSDIKKSKDKPFFILSSLKEGRQAYFFLLQSYFSSSFFEENHLAKNTFSEDGAITDPTKKEEKDFKHPSANDFFSFYRESIEYNSSYSQQKWDEFCKRFLKGLNTYLQNTEYLLYDNFYLQGFAGAYEASDLNKDEKQALCSPFYNVFLDDSQEVKVSLQAQIQHFYLYKNSQDAYEIVVFCPLPLKVQKDVSEYFQKMDEILPFIIQLMVFSGSLMQAKNLENIRAKLVVGCSSDFEVSFVELIYDLNQDSLHSYFQNICNLILSVDYSLPVFSFKELNKFISKNALKKSSKSSKKDQPQQEELPDDIQDKINAQNNKILQFLKTPFKSDFEDFLKEDSSVISKVNPHSKKDEKIFYQIITTLYQNLFLFKDNLKSKKK